MTKKLVSRRDFILVSAAAGAAGLAAGCVSNPAPTFEAAADRTIALPPLLSKPGSQVKVRLPGGSDVVLLWRTEIGFGAASLACAHCGADVFYNAQTGTLDCTTGTSRYKLDGTVLKGRSRIPLRAYAVDLAGDRLKILG
jgi:Rieske Fe-S protein